MRHPLICSVAALFLVTACESVPDEAAEMDAAGAAGGAPAEQLVEINVAPQPIEPVPPVAEIDAPVPLAPETEEYFVVEVGDRVFFGLNEFTLTEQARATLERQAEWLHAYPDIQVTIEGHTDERGTREYNLALGERRAIAVMNYLLALGIDPVRLETVSWGKERPVALGSNQTAWALNRRGVTTITGGAPVN